MKKKLFSLYPGSRFSEVNVLLPILFEFINLMNKKYENIFFVFHSTHEHVHSIQKSIIKKDFKNCEAISDEKIKSHILNSSIFAVAKSGTISLEICNSQIPSVIIYKMNVINFFIVKMLVKVNYANIINIAAQEEIIPELIQYNCNAKTIFKKVDEFLSNPSLSKNQIDKFNKIIKNFRTNKSSQIASSILIDSF